MTGNKTTIANGGVSRFLYIIKDMMAPVNFHNLTGKDCLFSELDDVIIIKVLQKSAVNLHTYILFNKASLLIPCRINLIKTDRLPFAAASLLKGGCAGHLIRLTLCRRL